MDMIGLVLSGYMVTALLARPVSGFLAGFLAWELEMDTFSRRLNSNP